MPAELALVRLLQLASPALPVGAYTYSQGLEQAVDAGTVRDEASAGRWIGDAMRAGIGRWEAPLVAALQRAWEAGDDARVVRLDREFVASREASELRAETLQMGHSMARLLAELPSFDDTWRARLAAVAEPAFPTAWSAAAAAWRVAERDAVAAYVWAWLESQVMAAVKAIPLGQTAAQRLLARLAGEIPALAQAACLRDEATFENFSPGLAIACAAHETQYSRLFRS